MYAFLENIVEFKKKFITVSGTLIQVTSFVYKNHLERLQLFKKSISHNNLFINQSILNVTSNIRFRSDTLKDITWIDKV